MGIKTLKNSEVACSKFSATHISVNDRNAVPQTTKIMHWSVKLPIKHVSQLPNMYKLPISLHNHQFLQIYIETEKSLERRKNLRVLKLDEWFWENVNSLMNLMLMEEALKLVEWFLKNVSWESLRNLRMFFRSEEGERVLARF